MADEHGGVQMKLAPLAIVLAAGTAHAFPTGNQFDQDALGQDGAGGVAFDGSPRFAGHTCSVCHTNPPGTIGVRLESDHPEMFTDGWVPGMQYHMRVVLLNEWAAKQYQQAGDNCGFSVTPYTPCDQNGFSLEFADINGGTQGKFVPVVNNACANSGTVPTDVDVRVMTDGGAVTHNGAHHGQIAWDLCWTAPNGNAGVLTAYIAVVDGNGGDGTMNFPADTIGDDVAAGAVPIGQLNGESAPSQNGGCNAGRDGGGALAALAVLALVVIRRRRALAWLVALATAGGCVHVRATERETLARRNMKFAPDPTEDELDLHMQEAREGSAGGYGSSGGGCGCN